MKITCNGHWTIVLRRCLILCSASASVSVSQETTRGLETTVKGENYGGGYSQAVSSHPMGNRHVVVR